MNKVSNSSRNIIKTAAAAIITSTVFAMVGMVATTNAQTLMDTGAATSIGATVDSGPAINTGSIRDKIRADIEARTQNLKNSSRSFSLGIKINLEILKIFFSKNQDFPRGLRESKKTLN